MQISKWNIFSRHTKVCSDFAAHVKFDYYYNNYPKSNPYLLAPVSPGIEPGYIVFPSQK